MAELGNRILQACTGTGTGALSLGAARTGYRRFVDDPAYDVAKSYYYVIVAVDADGAPTGQWEVGASTATAGTLARDGAVSDNSDGTTAHINFAAGTKDVFCDLPTNQTGLPGIDYIAADKALAFSGNTAEGASPVTIAGGVQGVSNSALVIDSADGYIPVMFRQEMDFYNPVNMGWIIGDLAESWMTGDLNGEIIEFASHILTPDASSGSIRLITGNVPSGLGVSGNIDITTGTSPLANVDEARGLIRLNGPVQLTGVTTSLARVVIESGAADSDLIFKATSAYAGTIGNGISVEFVDPAIPDQVLSVSVVDLAVTVHLATDGGGMRTSTANDVLNAVYGEATAYALVDVDLAPGEDGSGIVDAHAPTFLAQGRAFHALSFLGDMGGSPITLTGGDEGGKSVLRVGCEDAEWGLVVGEGCLPSSDPGVPGQLYHVAGAVMVSL